MLEEAIQQIGQRAQVRCLVRIFGIAKPARDIASEAGVNPDAKGEAKRWYAIRDFAIRIK